MLPLPPNPAAPKALKGLYRIVSSALQPSMASFGLQISVLLKGARGSGKRMIVRSLAARMGLGVLEVRHPTVLHDW
jgi:peroxin-6